MNAHLAIAVALMVSAGQASGQQPDESTEALAAAAQNPVAAMISLPFQNNTMFGIGPNDDVANVLNIQPVYPLALGADWNLINRAIVPIIYTPDVLAGIDVLPTELQGVDTEALGLGDINYSGFLSPSQPGSVIWGIGPSITVPTATDEVLGSGKWSAGPSAVVLTMPKPWVLGLLARQLWSFAGDQDRADVNQLLLQPFINYNLPGGWYLTSSPMITANWDREPDQMWTVPLGGGLGKIFRIGTQPVNFQVQAFYNVEHPTQAPDASLRFQLQFLFPK
jgi:hypothetical protein